MKQVKKLEMTAITKFQYVLIVAATLGEVAKKTECNEYRCCQRSGRRMVDRIVLQLDNKAISITFLLYGLQIFIIKPKTYIVVRSFSTCMH